MAVMGNPWCLQDCHYLNNLTGALRILFGFLDRNGKRSWVGHLEEEGMSPVNWPLANMFQPYGFGSQGGSSS